MDESDDRLNALIKLFNIHTKKEVIKHCRDLVVYKKDLANLILVGREGLLDGYLYKPYFYDFTPPELEPTDRDLLSLQQNGVGALQPSAQKTMNKITQIFKDRRLLCCHLFYTYNQKYWHLFYFDQRDLETSNNHWKLGGKHIHYSRESFAKHSLTAIWAGITSSKPILPASLHIRYIDTRR